MPFVTIEDPARRPAAGFALWQLGFRPFYLLASMFAALSIPLWALQYAGWLPHPYLAGPAWHAHEMLFGFALAVIVGFLFTAGRNWSGRPTPTGPALAALCLLWLAARVLVLTPYGWLAAAASTAFPLCAAVGLAIPFVAAKNKRNYFFVGLLVMMGVASLLVHLVQLRVLDLPGWLGIQVALDVVLFIMAVMGGRVIPMFTNNGVPGAGARREPRLETFALASVLAVLAADVLQVNGPALALILLACGMAQLARLALWQPWKTRHTPIVWVLHAAYGWIGLHLLLRSGAALGWLPSSVAAHALTVGAIGGMTLGMMTRTARGHTGRPLKADRFDVIAYLLILAAAVVRVAAAWAVPALTVPAVLLSAVLWSAAFGLYAIRYWATLTRARVDGLAG